MEDYERLKLRLACLELAKQVAIAQASGLYGVVDYAEKYWNWMIKQDPPPTQVAAYVETDDDIPF